MAWRLGEHVLSGELDNTQRGWTTGWLQLQGREEPLRLKLVGNCHPDLAGWKFRIVRSEPIPDWVKPSNFEGVVTEQNGTVGDVTASQKRRDFECSPREFVARASLGEAPPTEWRPALYLEWFGNRNGRILVESTRLRVEKLGERTFGLTHEEALEQARQNQEEISYFITQLGDALENDQAHEE